LASYERAIELKSDFADAYLNLGVILNELNRFDEALASYDKAIELKVDFADAYCNKSMLLLSLQDFENGWKLNDWRWKVKNLTSSHLETNKPKLINLESISKENKKILIWAEQGIGDQILYSSMLDQLLSIAPSSQIILDKRLLPLFRRSFAHGNFLDRISGTQDIEYDEHLPIGDLGKFFRTSSADFDLSRNNYLLADSLRAKEIRADLINNKKFLCGITWNSNREKTGAEKSIELDELLPILTNKNIAFVSLQYGDVQNQLIDFNEKHNLNIQECKSVDNFHDIDGHAALIEACDFVVTISNSSAHISGAIGKETFLMCPVGKGSIWYWSNQLNEKNLWYPSIHIFEQNLDGNWVDVVQRIKLVIEDKINVN
jgi:tetratricopeptide (TPR) repeat protein